MTEPKPTLESVWRKQGEYNGDMMDQRPMDSASWMTNYILGAISELGELLEQTRWKKHRIQSVQQYGPNVEEELADITKYIFSMWQIMNLSPQDMLNAVDQKSDILQQLMFQETRSPLIHKRIIMLDLDGVVADFRFGFMEWVAGTKWKDLLHIKEEQIGLHLDINNGWDYTEYNQAKLEFERDGGYGKLPVINLIRDTVNTLHDVGWYVIVHTARPQAMFKRIWGDTWNWLQFYNVKADELYFGYDDRITMAQLLSQNNRVIALEDDPTLIKRYLGCNIPVYIYPQPYNITTFNDYTLARKIDIGSDHWEVSESIYSTLERHHVKQGQRT